MPPLSLLIKPASGSCNMRCRYCFYTDEAENRAVPCMGMMSEETMAAMVDKALRYAEEDCSFAFQGGEPTLIGLDWFRRLDECIRSHPNPNGVRVHFSIQTNGYGLDGEWAKWLADHNALVGISLDGPRAIHDAYRVDRAGKGTFDRVMASIRLLEKYKVEFNILTVVSAANARRGQQVYEFFKKQNFRYQQYIECLDPIGETPGGHPYSLTPEQYATFLKTVFDCWYRDMKAGRYVFNRYFENLMMIMAGQRPESCSLQGCCAPQWVIEADGSVYPCDFYALDQWKLGSILTDSFEEMDRVRQDSGFIEMSRRLADGCRECPWVMLCRGGCRRNREPVSADKTGRNRFCLSYREFLSYAAPRLEEICRMLLAAARQQR